MEQSMIQFRVDPMLKKEVAEIYKSIGMDLPTALRMFLVRSKMMRGLPFEANLPKLVNQQQEVEEMTSEEINNSGTKIPKE